MKRSQKPYVIVFLGSIGAGKSHFARQLADREHLILINSDALRKAMNEPWSPNGDRLWNAMDYMVERALSAGKSIIYDAGRFNLLKSRRALRRIVEGVGARVLIVWINTPREIAHGRAQSREATEDQLRFTAEEAEQILQRHDRNFSPPGEGETYIVVDGTSTFTEQYRSFRKQLKEKKITL